MVADAVPHDYLTTREVAELLRVKERKVYDLASSGEIPCRRVTGKLLFPRADVEAWLTGGAGPAAALSPAADGERPNVVVGSHDPLLDWALREGGSGLATFFDGSLDGLDRIAGREAVACGLHVFEPGDGAWNVAHVRAALGQGPFVLIEWARRCQGLIVAPDCAGRIGAMADLAGRRVVLRQPRSGGRILFDHLLGAAGLDPGQLVVVAAAARTETDLAAAVAAGQADAALGLESMAGLFRLRFVPLIEERYDLLVHRRAYFEPPMQKLLAFCHEPAFAAKAREMGGYDLTGQGRVHWNGG